MKAVALAVVVALLVSGCTTLRPLSPGPSGAPPSFTGITPGDHLRLVTRDGHAHNVTVLTVEPATIRTTDNVRYQYMDVLTIERRTFDRKKNIVLVVTAGALTGLMIGMMKGLCVCTQ